MHDALGPRLGSSLLTLAAGLALVIGLWLLPDLTPDEVVPAVGQESLHGRIVEALPSDATGAPRFAIEVVEGPEAGARIEASVQDASQAMPGSSDRDAYEVGDEVVVARFTGPAGGTAVVTEPWRVPVLGILAGLFAVVVMIVGGLRGARSLVALALTLLTVVKLIVPLLLRGYDPIMLAVLGGAAVTVITLLLTEGANRVTASATVGTFAALALTAVLASLFTAVSGFTALQGNEEIAFLIPLVGERIDLQGILLAATVFGALGVLDDVTITQAATVEQLHRADARATRGGVMARAMRIGRSHIAATVNTLMLAYLGAGLPLLLLFALGGQGPLSVLNSEIVAVEVIRALVGSIGIVAAVPFTTLVATVFMVPSEPVAERAA